MMFLQMSISGAALILVIVFLRLCMGTRFPGRYRIVCWGIAACCLLTPFRVKSEFSIYRYLKFPQTVNITTDKNSAAANELQSSRSAGNEKLSDGQASAKVPANMPEKRPETHGRNSYPYVVNAIFTGIWLTGAAALTLFFCVVYLRCLREFKTSLPAQDAFTKDWLRRRSCRRRLNIRKSSTVRSPLTYGILRPVILLPNACLSMREEELSLILEHEYCHIRHFDTAGKLLFTFLLCLHWFNPLVWVMYFFVNRDLELACDERVLRHSETDIRADYAGMLLSMEESKNRFVIVGNSFGKNAIEERVVAIMKYKKTSVTAMLMTGALMCTVTAVFAASAAETETTDRSHTENDTSEYDSENMPGSEKIPPKLYEEQYKIYEPYGLSYDETGEYLVYDGKRVRYFIDEIQPGYYRRFLTENANGAVGVGVIRDEDGEILSLTSVPVPITSSEDNISFSVTEDTVSVIGGADGPTSIFIAGTRKPASSGEKIDTEEGSGEADLNNSIGWSYDTDSAGPKIPEEYQTLGITLNETDNSWMYKEAVIADLYDDNGFIYTQDNGEIYLHVIRDETGATTEITELMKEQMEVLLKDRNELTADIRREWTETLDSYEPFGLTYILDGSSSLTDEYMLSMEWNGKEVKSIYDPQKDIWISEHLGDADFSEDTVELYVIYDETAVPIGLREVTS